MLSGDNCTLTTATATTALTIDSKPLPLLSYDSVNWRQGVEDIVRQFFANMDSEALAAKLEPLKLPGLQTNVARMDYAQVLQRYTLTEFNSTISGDFSVDGAITVYLLLNGLVNDYSNIVYIWTNLWKSVKEKPKNSRGLHLEWRTTWIGAAGHLRLDRVPARNDNEKWAVLGHLLWCSPVHSRALKKAAGLDVKASEDVELGPNVADVHKPLWADLLSKDKEGLKHANILLDRYYYGGQVEKMSEGMPVEEKALQNSCLPLRNSCDDPVGPNQIQTNPASLAEEVRSNEKWDGLRVEANGSSSTLCASMELEQDNHGFTQLNESINQSSSLYPVTCQESDSGAASTRHTVKRLEIQYEQLKADVSESKSASKLLENKIMDMERGLAFVLAKLERTHHVVDTLKRDIASQSVSKFGYDSPIAPSSGLDLGFINRDAEAVRESTFKRLRCDSGDCHAVKAAISNEIQVTNSEPPLISGTQHNPINTLEATGTIETQANERCTEESAHQEENKSDNQAKFGFYHSGFYVHLAEYDGSHWIKYGATQRVGKRVNITPFKNVAHVAEVFAAEKGDRTVAKKKGWEEDWNQIMEKLSE